MKNLKLLLTVLLLSSTMLNAQEKYSAVQIDLPNDARLRAEVFGKLEVDHFAEVNGSVSVEISESALSKLRLLGYPFRVTTDDIVADLHRKNDEYFEARRRGLINMDGSPTAAGVAGRVAFEQQGAIVDNIIQTPTAFQVQSGSPNLGGYYTFDQMEAAMDDLISSYPGIASKTSLGTSVQGRNIWCIKISDNVATDEANEPEVLYIGVQHAREAIGGSSMIFFMQYLCEQYAANNSIKNLVDNREVFIIPCMNPDGWEYNRSNDPNGGGMWRKNRRNNGAGYYGVDLNRNWSVDWSNCAGAGSSCGSSSTSSDTYYGPSAFSEPESQAIRAFTKTRNFVAMIDQHCYGPYYSLPFGRPSLHTGPDNLSTMEQEYYTQIPSLMGKYNGMRAGNSPQSVGYEVAGGVKDWMLRGEIGVGTKQKVFGMTGEGGGGAFWAPANRIINLCKGMVFQNLQLLNGAGSYLDIQDMSDIALTAKSGSMSFKIKRIGLGDAPVTVTAIPITNISFGTAVTVPTMPNYYDSYTGNITFILPPSITNGQYVKFAWKVESSGYSYFDTVTKFYNPITLFSDNMETGSASANWTVNSGWAYETGVGYGGSRALSESPGTDYPANANRRATYNNTLNLSDATAAYITFQTKYRAENFHDKLQVQVSTNGTSWTPIAGKNTIQEPGTNEGSTIDGEPSLTGIKDDWVNELFDLSAYIGQSALHFRFRFTSDATSSFFYAEDEGFLIDNIKVIKSTTTLQTLAVNFISFTGKMLPTDDVQLDWQAEMDGDHRYFEVERSSNGTLFEIIGRVNRDQPNIFIDRHPFKGNNYYRLKAIDVSGTGKNSKVINVKYNPGLVLQIYPNPTKDELTVRFKDQVNMQVNMILTDLMGRVVLNASNHVQNGIVKLNLNNLKPQIYILKLTDTDGSTLDIQKISKL
ncbi:MAG TPA: M14 family zinc carboxypeptidase [Chitinophagaceae bacterium]|mgnify:CR=1 FL=1|nr:M14 family zinc carboxypeptidase [Chitinophagaceae bacterium]